MQNVDALFNVPWSKKICGQVYKSLMTQTVFIVTSVADHGVCVDDGGSQAWVGDGVALPLEANLRYLHQAALQHVLVRQHHQLTSTVVVYGA